MYSYLEDRMTMSLEWSRQWNTLLYPLKERSLFYLFSFLLPCKKCFATFRILTNRDSRKHHLMCILMILVRIWIRNIQANHVSSRRQVQRTSFIRAMRHEMSMVRHYSGEIILSSQKWYSDCPYQNFKLYFTIHFIYPF
jgi:hypothetical protein